MQIKCLPVGILQANCYIVRKDKKVVIIDPGDDAKLIEKNLDGLELVGVLLTHNHFDHIGALDYFLKKYNLKCNDLVKEFNYEIIKTPGHTNDSITIYFKDESVMFTGDFLFKNSIGRMDLPTGSKLDMKSSLDKISKYPDNIKIYPGHGEYSILGLEKNNFDFYKQNYL